MCSSTAEYSCLPRDNVLQQCGLRGGTYGGSSSVTELLCMQPKVRAVRLSIFNVWRLCTTTPRDPIVQNTACNLGSRINKDYTERLVFDRKLLLTAIEAINSGIHPGTFPNLQSVIPGYVLPVVLLNPMHRRGSSVSGSSV